MNVLGKILLVIVIAGLLVGGIYLFNQQEGTTPDSNQTAAAASSGQGAKGIVLNEVMASNGGIFPDTQGNYSDWAELYNGTGADISLSNMAISNSDKNPAKYPLPNVTLKAGGYMVIFLSGKAGVDEANNAYYAPFKLSASNGDTILLTNLAGEVLDKLEFAYMDENISYARINDKWEESRTPTPGFPNTDEGYSAFLASRKIANSPVVINEVMTSNKVTIADKSGKYYDYIEIVNRGDVPFNIAGFGITDDPFDPMQFRLPEVTLAPDECILVYCLGERLPVENPKEGIYAPFRLSSYKETVGLYDAAGKELDSVTVKELPSDTSYSRVYDGNKPTDEWVNTAKVTPYFPNTEEGYRDYLKKNELALGDLIINEVLAANTKIDFEGDKLTYDFIELKNRGSAAIDLTGYGLTTNTKNPAMWRFPQARIDPGENLVVLAQNAQTPLPENTKYIHTNFGLSKQGETLALFDSEGKIVDKINLDTTPKDISVGREQGKSGIYYFNEPAPGKDNANGAPGFTSSPTFSLVPGIYNSPQTVEITSKEGADIYYTTDCTTPTTNSQKYISPITVDKTTVIRALAVKEGYITGLSGTATYLLNVSHELPVCSLVTDPKNLWDEQTGIYVKGPNAEPEYPFMNANFWQPWEKPASFEVFNDLGKEVFVQNVSTRIAGAFGRGREQKAFAIIARNEYGDNRLRYPFFDNRPFNEYKALVLRQGGQDQNIAKIKDEVAIGLVDGKTNMLTQAYKPYVLYLNGEYWGVYFMKDKRNEYFVANYEGLDDPKNIDLLKATSIVILGSNKEYLALLDYIRTHDLSTKEAYDYVCERADVDSFMDYMICEIYIANSDYANIQFYKEKDGGKWKWIYYDFCWTFNATHPTLANRRKSQVSASDLFNGLLKNNEWRNKFLERFAELMDTVYTPENVSAKIDEIAGLIRSEMSAECEKFGGTVANWEQNLKKMKDFADKRPDYMKHFIQKEFGLSNDYMIKTFGSAGIAPPQS